MPVGYGLTVAGVTGASEIALRLCCLAETMHHLLGELQDEALLGLTPVLQRQGIHIPAPAGLLSQAHDLMLPYFVALLQ